MPRIKRDSLMCLEDYARARPEIRAQVMAHKQSRSVALGSHIRLLFEDELTIRYQIQEMLRAERIFEEDGIEAELSAYNPLIPDGSNWKATMLIEYPDPRQRGEMLARLIGVEDCVWVGVAGCQQVYAIADEDMARESAGKTSSVHFLRFELDAPAVLALQRGAGLAIGVDHPAYQAAVDSVGDATLASLLRDLTH